MAFTVWWLRGLGFVQLVPFRDEHGFTPTHYACMHGHSNIVELFLIRGARMDLVNMGGDTLLHMAAAFGKYDVVMKVSGSIERRGKRRISVT